MLPNVFFFYESSIARHVHRTTKFIKQFYATLGMYAVYQRDFNRKKKCFIRAPRHWQALIKRMNGQVIASV